MDTDLAPLEVARLGSAGTWEVSEEKTLRSAHNSEGRHVWELHTEGGEEEEEDDDEGEGGVWAEDTSVKSQDVSCRANDELSHANVTLARSAPSVGWLS